MGDAPAREPRRIARGHLDTDDRVIFLENDMDDRERGDDRRDRRMSLLLGAALTILLTVCGGIVMMFVTGILSTAPKP